jgi:hypothetical protein
LLLATVVIVVVVIVVVVVVVVVVYIPFHHFLAFLSSPCSPYNTDKQIILFLFRSEIRKQAKSCSALRTGDVFQAKRIKVQGQFKGWQFVDEAGDYKVSVRNLIHTVG